MKDFMGLWGIRYDFLKLPLIQNESKACTHHWNATRVLHETTLDMKLWQWWSRGDGRAWEQVPCRLELGKETLPPLGRGRPALGAGGGQSLSSRSEQWKGGSPGDTKGWKSCNFITPQTFSRHLLGGDTLIGSEETEVNTKGSCFWRVPGQRKRQLWKQPNGHYNICSHLWRTHCVMVNAPSTWHALS